MKKVSLLYLSLVLMIILAVTNSLAHAFYLYWNYWWFDNMMHFLAGVAGGAAALWVLFYSGIFFGRMPRVLEFTAASFVCVIIAGVGWEIFEYVNGITEATENYLALDIFHDLLSDSAGAVVAGYVGASEIFHTRRQF